MHQMFHRIILAVIVAGFTLTACSGGNGATEPPDSKPTNPPLSDTPAGPSYSKEAINEGTNLFAANCSACHGADANGVQGLGKGLRNNQFVQDKTDEGLMEFIIAGRPADDPLNTTGVIMPPKGGNPSLSEDQIQNIIAFLRSLQE